MNVVIRLVYAALMVTGLGLAVLRFVPAPRGLGKRMAIVGSITLCGALISLPTLDIVKHAFRTELGNAWSYFVMFGTGTLYISKMGAADREAREVVDAEEHNAS